MTGFYIPKSWDWRTNEARAQSERARIQREVEHRERHDRIRNHVLRQEEKARHVLRQEEKARHVLRQEEKARKRQRDKKRKLAASRAKAVRREAARRKAWADEAARREAAEELALRGARLAGEKQRDLMRPGQIEADFEFFSKSEVESNREGDDYQRDKCEGWEERRDEIEAEPRGRVYSLPDVLNGRYVQHVRENGDLRCGGGWRKNPRLGGG